MNEIINTLNNCTISNKLIKLPTTTGIERRVFLILKHEFSLLNGNWIADDFGFEFAPNTDLTLILNSLKTKIKND